MAPPDPRLPGGGGYVVSGLYDVVPEKAGQVNNLVADSGTYGRWYQYFHGIDVTLNVRVGQNFTFMASASTGQTVAKNCDVRAHLPELATTTTGTRAFGAGLATSPVTPVSPYCHVASGFLTQFKGFSSYVIPKIESQVAATFQSKPGPMLAANYAAPNSVVAPSLGRNLSGNAANVTVNLVPPGTMYGDRINQLDLRVAKVLRRGGSQTTIAIEMLQRHELERGAVLQQRFHSGRDLVAATDRTDAAIHQGRRRVYLLNRAMAQHSSAARRVPRGWPLALVVSLSILGPGDEAEAQDSQKRVLVLHSGRRDAQLTVTVEAKLPSLLESGLPEGGLDYYSEYIDEARFSREEYPNEFRDFLRQKYQELRIDAIIPVGNAAIQFLFDNRDVLFGDTPLVFYTTVRPGRPIANSTGIVNVLRFDRSIDLALTLQPDLRHLFVVSGAAAADQRADQQARAEFGRFEDRLQITVACQVLSRTTSRRDCGRCRLTPPFSSPWCPRMAVGRSSKRRRYSRAWHRLRTPPRTAGRIFPLSLASSAATGATNWRRRRPSPI